MSQPRSELRFFFLVAAALAVPPLLTGCGKTDGNASATIEDAWVRLPAVAGRPGAAYFAIETGRPDVLLQVEASSAARAEMHESMERGAGMAAMRPLETLALGEGETRFEPGGKHVMLYEIDPTLKPGAVVELSFRFAKAAPVTVDARTVSAGDPAPME